MQCKLSAIVKWTWICYNRREYKRMRVKMRLISINKAASLTGSPSRRTLYNKCHSKPRLSYVHKKAGEYKIDMSDPVWKKYINSLIKSDSPDLPSDDDLNFAGEKAPKKPKSSRTKKPKRPKFTNSNSATEENYKTNDNKLKNITELLLEAEGILIDQFELLKIRNMELKNEKIKKDNRLLDMKIRKDEGDLIDMQLAKYLFFGHMERTNLEMLRLPNTMAAKIDALVKENDSDAIIKEMENEISIILFEVKKSQKQDLEDHVLERENSKK